MIRKISAVIIFFILWQYPFFAGFKAEAGGIYSQKTVFKLPNRPKNDGATGAFCFACSPALAGRYYYYDASTFTLFSLNSKGEIEKKIKIRDIASLSEAPQIVDIAVSMSNNIYLLDACNSKIITITSDFKFGKFFLKNDPFEDSYFHAPGFLSCDSDENIRYCDPATNSTLVFSKNDFSLTGSFRYPAFSQSNRYDGGFAINASAAGATLEIFCREADGADAMKKLCQLKYPADICNVSFAGESGLKLNYFLVQTIAIDSVSNYILALERNGKINSNIAVNLGFNYGCNTKVFVTPEDRLMAVSTQKDGETALIELIKGESALNDN